MKKLKLQVQTSVDGYIADDQGGTGWMIWNWGPEWTWDAKLQKHFIELHTSIDTILLSRKMAEEGFIGHWARVSQNPDDTQYPFASIIAGAEKIVFTKTLQQSRWENTRLAQRDLVTEVKALKKQPGRDLIVYGGVALATSLMEAGLIDEFHLFVNPVVLGKGLSLFKEPGQKRNLRLLDSQTFDCGITVLTYTP